jgi:hypothetical protein
VIASDPRFAGSLPSALIARSWSPRHEAWSTADGFGVSVTLEHGDCAIACIGSTTVRYRVAPDGSFGPPIQEGDPLPGDFQARTGFGDGRVILSILAAPRCPLEPAPPASPCSRTPVRGADIAVREWTGRHVTTISTDDRGLAEATLPTGTYVFEPMPVPRILGVADAFAVSVLGPTTVALHLVYDTGLR